MKIFNFFFSIPLTKILTALLSILKKIATMLSENEFIKGVENLSKTIPGKNRDASYTDFKLQGDTLYFKRIDTGKNWKLNIRQLYQIYRSNDFINTTVIKNATKGRVNSPSVAVLMAIGCLDEKGIRI